MIFLVGKKRGFGESVFGLLKMFFFFVKWGCLLKMFFCCKKGLFTENVFFCEKDFGENGYFGEIFLFFFAFFW